MMTQSRPDGNNNGGLQICPVCGYSDELDAVFCSRCGTVFDLDYEECLDPTQDAREFESPSPRSRPSLSQQCPVCGELNRPGVLLCEACGTNLTTGQRQPMSTRIMGEDLQRLADVPLEGADTVDIEELATDRGSLSGTGTFSPDMILRMQIEDVEKPILLRMATNHPIVFGRQDATDQPIDIDLGIYSGYAKGISRIHAAMELIENRLELMDIGSSNGTYLNGNRLGPNQRHQLRDGDEIRFGRLIMVIYFEKRVQR